MADGKLLETKRIWRQADAVCFDVDSTLVTIEGLDSLAEYCGVGDEVKQWTTRAMGGAMSFQESFKARLDIVKPTEQQLKDFSKVHSLQDILSPNVGKLIDLLLKKGTQVYLVSGGLRTIIEPMMDYLNIPKDHLYANRIFFDSKGCYSHFDDQEPTSRTGGKPAVVEKLKKEKGYKCVVMIGDGATDLEACPPADAFIGYGGNVIRQKVKDNSSWFVTNFQDLIDCLVH